MFMENIANKAKRVKSPQFDFTRQRPSESLLITVSYAAHWGTWAMTVSRVIRTTKLTRTTATVTTAAMVP